MRGGPLSKNEQYLKNEQYFEKKLVSEFEI